MGVDAKMCFMTTDELSDEEIMQKQWRLAEAFYRGGPLWLTAPGVKDWDPHGRKAFVEVDEYWQDGPSLYAGLGERLFEVSLGTRFYGKGYERGDLPGIIAVAEWIYRNFNSVRVFYGGDSSGCEAKELTPDYIDDLYDHWALNGHMPYIGGFTMSDVKGVHMCDFCQAPTHEFGWGGGKVLVACPGCGRSWSTMDQGQTYELRKPDEKDF